MHHIPARVQSTSFKCFDWCRAPIWMHCDCSSVKWTKFCETWKGSVLIVFPIFSRPSNLHVFVQSQSRHRLIVTVINVSWHGSWPRAYDHDLASPANGVGPRSLKTRGPMWIGNPGTLDPALLAMAMARAWSWSWAMSHEPWPMSTESWTTNHW